MERFLKQIGFPYTIAYGMTECGPIICSSRWETLKLASCGKATTRMEVKIDSPDPQNVAGEIICKGANLMLGYYKNAEATSQIIDVNGWLHTGDLATMDTEDMSLSADAAKTCCSQPVVRTSTPRRLKAN